MKFYNIQISNLATPEEEPFHSQVLELRDTFLEGLKEIQSKERLKFIESRKKNVAGEISKKKNSIARDMVSEEIAIKAADVLTEVFLDRSRVR